MTLWTGGVPCALRVALAVKGSEKKTLFGPHPFVSLLAVGPAVPHTKHRDVHVDVGHGALLQLAEEFLQVGGTTSAPLCPALGTAPPHPRSACLRGSLTSVNSVEPMSPNSSAPQLANTIDLRGRQVPGEGDRGLEGKIPRILGWLRGRLGMWRGERAGRGGAAGDWFWHLPSPAFPEAPSSSHPAPLLCCDNPDIASNARLHRSSSVRWSPLPECPATLSSPSVSTKGTPDLSSTRPAQNSPQSSSLGEDTYSHSPSSMMPFGPILTTTS